MAQGSFIWLFLMFSLKTTTTSKDREAESDRQTRSFHQPVYFSSVGNSYTAPGLWQKSGIQSDHTLV